MGLFLPLPLLGRRPGWESSPSAYPFPHLLSPRVQTIPISYSSSKKGTCKEAEGLACGLKGCLLLAAMGMSCRPETLPRGPAQACLCPVGVAASQSQAWLQVQHPEGETCVEPSSSVGSPCGQPCLQKHPERPSLRKPGTPVVLESGTGRLGSCGISCMCPVVRLSLD